MEKSSARGKVPAGVPRGFRARLKRRIAAAEGVARAGGARRWWLLGLRRPAVAIESRTEEGLRIRVQIGAAAGGHVLEIGNHLQELIIAAAREEAAGEVAAVDVYIEPGL